MGAIIESLRGGDMPTPEQQYRAIAEHLKVLEEKINRVITQHNAKLDIIGEKIDSLHAKHDEIFKSIDETMEKE